MFDRPGVASGDLLSHVYISDNICCEREVFKISRHNLFDSHMKIRAGAINIVHNFLSLFVLTLRFVILNSPFTVI